MTDNSIHISGAGTNTTDIPSIRTHRNGTKLRISERVTLNIRSHPSTDKLLVIVTENGDEYIVRSQVILAAAQNAIRTGRIRDPEDFGI